MKNRIDDWFGDEPLPRWDLAHDLDALDQPADEADLDEGFELRLSFGQAPQEIRQYFRFRGQKLVVNVELLFDVAPDDDDL